MTSRLWRLSQRVSQYASLAEQFVRDRDGGSADDEVSQELYFGTAETPNFTASFSITGSSLFTPQSQGLYGPPPGVTATEWFRRDDVQRVVLVEIDYYTQVGSGTSAVPTLTTKYLATAAYFDDENSRVYRDCVLSIPRYQRALDRSKLRGKFQSSMGVMTLANDDGAFSDLLTIACDGSEIRFYIGDINWSRSQFIYVFSATTTKIEAPSIERLEVTLKDNSALVDVPIGGTQTLGGTEANANQLRPYLLGYVHNVTCTLQSYADQRYVHSEDRTAQSSPTVITPAGTAVRDKGEAVGFEDDNDGSVRLHAPAVGLVTADVLRLASGRSPLATDWILVDTPNYAFRLSNVFYEIYVNTYGYHDGPLAFKFRGALPSYFEGGLNDYFVGFVLTDQTNLWNDLTDQLCDTGNCFVAFQRDGYLVYGRMRPDALEYLTTTGSTDGSMPVADEISFDDLLGGSERKPPPLRISKLEPSYYEIQGYANKNWTIQTEFAGDVVTTNTQALYRRDGYYAASYVGEDGADATAYLGAVSDPLLKTAQGGAPQKYHKTMTKLQGAETWISCYSDLDAGTMLAAWEALRRAQFLPWTTFVDFTVDLSFFQLELGDVVRLKLTNALGNAIHDLGDTLTQVVSIDIGLTEGTINLGVVYRRPAISTY